MKKIVVAGGCFWGVEAYFQKVKGIEKTIVGYVNSDIKNISYEQVCSQQYHAIEGVLLEYNPNVISLEKIMQLLFRVINPTSLDRQGYDIGYSYRVGAYYEDEKDAQIINEFLNEVKNEYQKPIVFEVKPLKNFTIAEEYHQDYLEKNPGGYCHINFNVLKPEEKK